MFPYLYVIQYGRNTPPRSGSHGPNNVKFRNEQSREWNKFGICSLEHERNRTAMKALLFFFLFLQSLAAGQPKSQQNKQIWDGWLCQEQP